MSTRKREVERQAILLRGEWCCSACRKPIMWRNDKAQDETGQWQQTGVCACPDEPEET